LTTPLSVLRFIARLCLQKYDEFITLQSSREQQGNTGKNKEMTKGLSLSLPPHSIYHIRFSRCNTMQIAANKHMPFLHPLRTWPLV